MVIEPTTEMRAAVGSACYDQLNDDERAAVAAAVLAIVERDYDVRPRTFFEQVADVRALTDNANQPAGEYVHAVTGEVVASADFNHRERDVLQYQLRAVRPAPFEVQIRGMLMDGFVDRVPTQCPRCTSPYRYHRFAITDGGGSASYCGDPWHSDDAITSGTYPPATEEQP